MLGGAGAAVGDRRKSLPKAFLGACLLSLGSLITAAPSAAAESPAPALDGARISAAVKAADLAGTVLIAQGDRILFERAYGAVEPNGTAPHHLGKVWRWASVSKQVTATLAMQEVAAGRLDLDQPITRYLPQSRAPHADTLTARMLMQHVSGLRHADDFARPEMDGWTTFYTAPLGSAETGVTWCEGPTGKPDKAPPADFRYGDCDFILMGAVLEAITGKTYAALVAERIAGPLGLRALGVFPTTRRTVPGFDQGKPESRFFHLENFGPAGALYGTTHDLLAFDRALMTGKLVPPAQRAVMWTGEPRYGYAALGQWAFEAALKGCDGAGVQIIERRGFIGGVVLRNIILPELDMVLIMTSNRASAEATFGEIWQQAGLTHDVLAAALCKAS
ncbi:MAG: serine hydrolase [Novosphingobium sp. PASSN1]|nr:MAG: serine hydrolase [Novosphingobium sp. PASSN1]